MKSNIELSVAEENHLRDVYEQSIKFNIGAEEVLKSYFDLSASDENHLTKESPVEQHLKKREIKESIIKFCVENGVLLYNIEAILDKKEGLLNHLSALFPDTDQINEDLIQGRKAWVDEFKSCLEQQKNAARALHEKNYTNVLHQFEATGAISEKSLLTFEDVQDLLDEFKKEYVQFCGNKEPRVTLAPLINLKESIETHNQKLTQLIDSDSPLFVGIIDENHWICLLSQSNNEDWDIKNPQTKNTANPLILQEILNFLYSLKAKKHVTGIQHKFGTQEDSHTCGTHVLNYYRELWDAPALSHKEMLDKALEIQQRKKPKKSVQENNNVNESLHCFIKQSSSGFFASRSSASSNEIKSYTLNAQADVLNLLIENYKQKKFKNAEVQWMITGKLVSLSFAEQDALEFFMDMAATVPFVVALNNDQIVAYSGGDEKGLKHCNGDQYKKGDNFKPGKIVLLDDWNANMKNISHNTFVTEMQNIFASAGLKN